VQSSLAFEPELLTDVQRAAIAIRVQLIEVFRRMLALGVTMVAGTDAGTRRSTLDRLPGELELYVDQLGLTPVAAIATATGGAAAALGLSAEVGTVLPGRQADLTVVDGDPSVDIGVLKRARAVIQGGRLVAEHGRLLT
jgi:imidazolonepropionase-like amidohydrolase